MPAPILRCCSELARLFIVVALVLASGCARERDDSTPDGAAWLFVDAIDRSRWDREALRDAYALVDEESQRRLMERARSATALGAREYEPWEMIVEGRARLRFTPARGSGVRVRESSDARAVVVLTGEHQGESAELALVREDEGWRVVLDVPPHVTRP